MALRLYHITYSYILHLGKLVRKLKCAFGVGTKFKPWQPLLNGRNPHPAPPQPPNMPPKLSSFPYSLRPLWEQLRRSPFSPQKALYSNNGRFIPSWSMWNHESWHLNQSSDGGVIFLWEVILSENRQNSRITSRVKKATSSLEGRLGNCTVSLQLDGYWSEQAPKPRLHSC